MATNSSQLAPSPANAPPMPEANEGSGIGTKVAIGVLVVAAIVALGVFASQLTGSSDKETVKTLLHKVTTGEMVITVIEDGNVESASNIDIKCRVSGGSSILSIVEDGTVVKKGDELVQLDSASLEDKIDQQTITFNTQKSNKVEAETAVTVAEISVTEYLEGILKQELQTADANITIGMENLRSAQNSFEHTKKMFRKGFVSVLELESQEFGVKNAQLNLDSMKTAKEVLVKFKKAKMLAELRSTKVQAEAKLESVLAQYKLEERKLADLKDEFKYTKIIAPQDGMVVYANPRSRWGSSQGSQIEEGSTVRERQTIIQLPDLSRMQVKVSVHETKVEKLSRGMPARIKIQGRELMGEITSIANQPEQGSWFAGNVKEYATIVRIKGSMEGLKPGMTAEVEILVAHKKSAVTLPVAAVVEMKNTFFCWVQDKDNKFHKRNLVLGMTDDKYVEVKDGVAEGDMVVLNPRAAVEGAKDGEEESSVDVTKKFGKANVAAAGKKSGKSYKSARGGAARGGARGGRGGGARGGAGGKSGKRGGGKKGRRQAAPWSELLKGDKNKDGKLSKEEMPARYSRFFGYIDTNKDGFLDKSEYSKMRNRGGKRGGGKRGGGKRGGGGQE